MEEFEFYLTMTRKDGSTYPIYRHKEDHTRLLPMFTDKSNWTEYLQEEMDRGNIDK